MKTSIKRLSKFKMHSARSNSLERIERSANVVKCHTVRKQIKEKKRRESERRANVRASRSAEAATNHNSNTTHKQSVRNERNPTTHI